MKRYTPTYLIAGSVGPDERKEIQSIKGFMEEDPDGEWVKYEDVKAEIDKAVKVTVASFCEGVIDSMESIKGYNINYKGGK